MIKVRDLRFSYNSAQLVLHGVNLDIEQGERLAIMGPSGCGKSTLLAILGGLLRPVSGSYEFDGKHVNSFTASQMSDFRGDKVGFVFQNFALLSHLTLVENLYLPVEHLKLKRGDMHRQAMDLLAKTGIEGLANRLPSEVSGGQAQRAAIARSMMRQPSIILADEPTGSLDKESSDEVVSLLNSLADKGTTVVAVTHSEAMAQGLSRTVCMHEGKVLRSTQVLSNVA